MNRRRYGTLYRGSGYSRVIVIDRDSLAKIRRL